MTDKILIERSVVEQALKVLEYAANDVLTGRNSATALRAALEQPQVEQEPVTAQHRFRHPQKAMLDWSIWQPCKVAKRPAWDIDSQGYEVEYRALYTSPQPSRKPLVAELQDAFFEGFCAVETYNDIRLNSVEEEWEKYKTAHGIKEQK